MIDDPAIQPDGSFVFDRAFFESLLGTAMVDGPYTLRMQAEDAFGNTSDLFELFFTLDTTPPPLTLDLAPEFDTGVPDDSGTSLTRVTLEGLTEAGALVELFRSDALTIPLASTTADAAGNYSFSGVALTPGDAGFTSIATDIAGNATQTNRVIRQERRGSGG